MTTAVLWPEARFSFSCPTQGSFVALKTFTRLDAPVYDDALFCIVVIDCLSRAFVNTAFYSDTLCLHVMVAITTTLQRL